MEKRWSERKELKVGVDIYWHSELLDSCFSSDIGLGGTFLSMGSSINIQKDNDVELVFHLISPEQETRHKIHARVTRISGDGVGFKFCNFDTGVFRSLQEIMTYRGAVKAAAYN